ncbi:alginate export family protein [Geomonas sp.]|uniref:alginate export family protein n=1 Tax=Geomonas sp. TaxID=2651584 RepID=UPI002B48CCFE|nr:alginate export family protein [Geomonas sp.]HJV33848.1 alginate export family protein [Geomonas sp.]
MLKGVVIAVAMSVSVSVAGAAFAHEDVDGKGGAAVPAETRKESPPGLESVPGPPPVETPEAKAEVLYRLGINGFLRGEGAGNFNLGDVAYQPQHSEGRFLYRIKPYGFWHPTDYLDLHVEGQAYGFTGGGSDDWNIGLYQAYVEAKLPDSKLFALKGGRQEFVYGSTFMLGADSFFDGLTFDGGRLRLQPSDSVTVDLLGGAYAWPWAGTKGNVSGSYATWALSEGTALEGYFLRDSRKAGGQPQQIVNSFGLRGTAKFGPLSLEVEPVYQTGQVFDTAKGENDDVSAYGGHADLTGEFETAGIHHKLWTGFAIGSGSRAAADGISAKHQFSNPDNDTALVGDMHVFGDLSGGDVNGHRASGLQIYTLGWGVDFSKQLNLSATGHYFRAEAVETGLSKNLGLETDFILTYTISDNFALLLAYDHFFTGAFFKDATGSSSDIHYGYAMLQFNLEKSKLKAAKKIDKGA